MRIILSLLLTTVCLNASAMEFNSDALLPFSADVGPGMLGSIFKEFGYWWRG